MAASPAQLSAPDNGAGQVEPSEGRRPTLNAAVRRRRADQDFYLRLRDAMAQNQRALERLGR